MADNMPPTAPTPIELLPDDTLGYCDPVTGVCALPEAASNATDGLVIQGEHGRGPGGGPGHWPVMTTGARRPPGVRA